LPNGCPVANGVLFFSLSADAQYSLSGAVAPKVQQVTLNAQGSIPAATTLIANDELTPAGTQYTLAVNGQGGGRVWGPEIFSITGASPINLNNFVPVAAGGPSFPTPIVASPTGAQTISGFPLTMKAGAAVVGGLTADSVNTAKLNFQENATISLVTGNNNNLAIGGAAAVLLSGAPGSTPTVTGMLAGSLGDFVAILNNTSQPCVLSLEDVNSTGNNRFRQNRATNHTLNANFGSALCMWDGLRWNVIGATPGS
jgi:hypothetical protein